MRARKRQTGKTVFVSVHRDGLLVQTSAQREEAARKLVGTPADLMLANMAVEGATRNREIDTKGRLLLPNFRGVDWNSSEE